MLAARTKKVAAYGRRGHRVVAVTDNHYLAPSKVEHEGKKEQDGIWEVPRPTSTNEKAIPPRSARPSASHRVENGPGLPKVRKQSYGTPNRRVLATVSHLTRNSPVPSPLIVKQGSSASKHKYKPSGLGQSRPVVDVEITVVDDGGKVLSQERRVSTPRAVRMEEDSDAFEEKPLKKSARTRQRRKPPYRIESSDDEDLIADIREDTDTDTDYVPDPSPPSGRPMTTKPRKPTVTYSKAKPSRRKTTVASSSTSPERMRTARARTSRRAVKPARPIVLSDSESSSSTELLTPEAKSEPSKQASMLLVADAPEPQSQSSVEILLPRLSQLKVSVPSRTKTSKPQHSALAVPPTNHGSLGNSPAPFARTALLPRPRTIQPGPSKPHFRAETRRSAGIFPIPIYDSDDDFDDFDDSVDEELAEALRNAELNMRKEQKEIRAVKKSNTTQNNADMSKRPRKTTAAKLMHNRPAVGGPLGSLLVECNQETPLNFDTFIRSFPVDSVHSHTDSTPLFCKIGEASYSEVFGIGEVVLKIIPLQASGNGRCHAEAIAVDAPFTSDINDVLKEIVVTRAMGAMCRGFTKLIRAHVVRGRYPKSLLALWEKYNQRKGSEGIKPDMFTDAQLYTVIILANGGPDLEAFSFPSSASSWRQACSIFWQVTRSIAQAEMLAHFEHRDLHWGQILVKSTITTASERTARRKKRATLAVQEILANERQAAPLMDDPSHGVEPTIIDLGLSRMECDISRTGSGKYWTSFDEEIFNGSGDYQYDIYRMMRHHNSDNWENYNPLTNVMWLHYLVDKLLYHKGLRAPSGRPALVDDSGNLTSAQAERRAHACLREVDVLLSRSIASEAQAVKVKTLKKRKDVVIVNSMASLRSANDLVGYARKQGWVA